MGSVGRGLYDKYGTYENIKRTAAEHPKKSSEIYQHLSLEVQVK